MKKALLATIIGLSVLACPILYILFGPALTDPQLETLKIILIIAGCSAVYCFTAGEITKNYSQMDKLWSILPEVYTWVIAVRGDFAPRLVIMAILATIWGIRLTYNFGRKGAYRLKFWEGTEDYRWVLLRNKKEFQPHWKWVIFNLLFISVYQNLLILMTTFPALVSLGVNKTFGIIDIIAAVLMLGFISLETVADEQQWKFQSEKWRQINEGKALDNLPAPYNKGFNTVGLWSRSKHPNYLGEQGTWMSFYIFSIGAGIGIFNWSIIGALLLIVMFAASSTLAEEISSSKYPEYDKYRKSVSKFFPVKKYNG